MEVRRVHHITIAVRDVERASSTFASLFGAPTIGATRDIEAFDAKSIDADLAGTGVQFVAPASAEGALTRFIERKGEGVYSIALEVADLDVAVRELRERGVRISEPVEATPGTRSAFITMAATHGVSIQLIEGDGEKREMGSIATPEDETADVHSPAPDEQAASAASPPLLDLTPDEWSDTD